MRKIGKDMRIRTIQTGTSALLCIFLWERKNQSHLSRMPLKSVDFDNAIRHLFYCTKMKFFSAFLVLVVVSCKAEPLETTLTGITTDIWETTGDANQGVAVDAEYIYAVTNRRITKMRKDTGEVSCISRTAWKESPTTRNFHYCRL